MSDKKKADSTPSDRMGRPSDEDQPSDEDLVSEALAGSDRAYAELVRRHRGRAINIAYHILGNRADAEDAAQEAFIRAYRGLPEFRGESDFSWWLYRIITNVSLEAARRGPVPGVPYRDDLQAPDEGLRAEEETDAALTVARAIGALPPEQRAVLTLRELDGFDYQEIAEILSIPIGTVRSRLYAARKAFRRALEEGEES
jgi:RNA polymerase sigma-70 factor (ECF subfamily)